MWPRSLDIRPSLVPGSAVCSGGYLGHSEGLKFELSSTWWWIGWRRGEDGGQIVNPSCKKGQLLYWETFTLCNLLWTDVSCSSDLCSPLISPTQNLPGNAASAAQLVCIADETEVLHHKGCIHNWCLFHYRYNMFMSGLILVILRLLNGDAVNAVLLCEPCHA